MATNLLIPSIEKRLGSFLEVSRRKLLEHGLADDKRVRPTITLTREFGCEGYPVALKLQTLLEEVPGTVTSTTSLPLSPRNGRATGTITVSSAARS
jgi:hypothetical protein